MTSNATAGPSTLLAHWVSSLASTFTPPPVPWDAAANSARAPIDAPFYHLHRPRVLNALPDPVLAVAAPFCIYWVMSAVFMLLDWSDLRALDRYRIHEPAELKTKNRVGKWQVVRAVLLQQALQTALGLYWLDGDDPSHGALRDHRAAIANYARHLVRALTYFVPSLSLKSSSPIIADSAHWLYWWGVPITQFVFAAFILDAWQYGWHRYFHVNKFLYRHVHSIHHRLYVPYAFGALYNHPLEGFMLDSLGAVIAENLAGLTTRQAILFFAISTAKTVDDHCGYALPWDPFQRFFANNSDYHDLHHQIAGLKSNFSQPYFIHFDRVFGTRMTRQEFEARKARRSHPSSKVNGPNELADTPTSKRNGMALKEE